MMPSITINSCHLPDEYIDAAISLDAETSEAPTHPSAGDFLHFLVPRHWHRSNKNSPIKRTADQHVGMKLCDYDLPDEYVDAAVLSFDDSDKSGYENTLPSPVDLLGSVVTLGCLHQPSEDRNDTANVALSDYDFPDEYISAEVSASHREVLAEGNAGAQRTQPLDDRLGESIHKILSYEPHVGLSRRRREYPSRSSNKTTSSTIMQNDLTFRLSKPQKSTNNVGSTNNQMTAEDEWIPEMKARKGETLLRKRRSSKSVSDS